MFKFTDMLGGILTILVACAIIGFLVGGVVGVFVYCFNLVYGVFA